MTEKTIKLLLQRYLDGNADPNEIAKVEKWYAALDKNEAGVSPENKKVIGEKMLHQLRKSMEESPKIRKINLPELFIRVAAVLLVTLSFGYGFWKINKIESNSSRYTSITTKAGERKKITLSDGSEILLQPSGRLTYPECFNPDSRSVTLVEGEAFFTVTHDKQRPFTVHHSASNLDIKVLGTSFNVKAFINSPEVLIDVASGKVAVNSQKRSFGILTKGKSLKFDKKTGVASVNHTKQQKYINLQFEGATLQQVIQKLEYVYTIRILLGEGIIPTLKCTAEFSSSQQPEEILDIICSLHHLKFIPSADHKTFKIYR